MTQEVNKLEVLETAQEYMEKLTDGINTASDLFMAGNETKALEYTIKIIEGLQWTTEVFALTQDIQKEKIEITTLTIHLQELQNALENNDYVLVGDLLSYEVFPVLEDWKQKNAMNL